MKIDRMNKGSWGKVRAFFDVQTEEGITMKGFKLVEGINGLFVGFPSQKGSDDEYRDTIWAEKDLKDSIKGIDITVVDQIPIKKKHTTLKLVAVSVHTYQKDIRKVIEKMLELMPILQFLRKKFVKDLDGSRKLR